MAIRDLPDRACAAAAAEARRLLLAFENGNALPDDDSALINAVNSLRRSFRHRPGNEIPALVEDTIEQLGLENRSKLRPVVSHAAPTQDGWRIVLSLPPGVSSKDVEAKILYIYEQCGASAIELEPQGPSLIMQIHVGKLPGSVMFAALEWRHPAGAIAPVVIGVSAKGIEAVDLATLPHMLVAGVPGGGKSNSLHVMLACLIASGVQVCIIDLKRLEFHYLRHYAQIATSVGEARQMLTILNDEMDRRLTTLERAECVKYQEYMETGGRDMPYIVLVIDELAELQDEDSQVALQRLLRLARAAGISVICATQRPSSTTFAKFGDCKANFSGSLCFRVRDAVNSRMVLDDDRAAQLPLVPGRAIWQQGNTEVEVQAPYLPVKEARRLAKQARQVNSFALTMRFIPRLQPRRPGSETD